MPAVARIGDADITHCTPTVRAQGSPNVFANGIPISRQGDTNAPHFAPPHNPNPPAGFVHPLCTLHTAGIAVGSRSVFVNGKGCGRVGDAISGCTAVAQGSPNVFAGG